MRQLFPISLFVIPFGIAFGVTATEQGIGPVEALLMSVLVFSAVAQFAALEFLTEPVAYISLGLVVFALSTRNIIIGAALSKWVNRLPIGQRLLSLTFLSDANFSIAHTDLQDGGTDLGPFLGGGVMLWITWIGGTGLGAFAGDLIGDTEIYGIGAVMPCFFAATVFGKVRGSIGMMLPVCVAMIVSVLEPDRKLS